MNVYAKQIAEILKLSVSQVDKTLTLLADGATIPFISRYRKEATGSLDEVQITDIRDKHKQLFELDKRKEAVIESIREQEKLTPDLEQRILKASNMAEVEDIYLPYKPKRKTRATIAVAKGLEPLAKWLFDQNNGSIEQQAERFISKEKQVETIEDALSGARDIMAEWVNEHAVARAQIRRLFNMEAVIYSKPAKGKEEEAQNYSAYFDIQENFMKAPSHRVLAMLRGENEGLLSLKIMPDEEKAVEILEKLFVKNRNESAGQLKMAIKDSYKRLLQSSIETEIRDLAKEKADKEAIRVFAENLRQLLLASPLGPKNVLAIDPGFRTGCKVVCLDKQGNLLHNETIYPHPPQREESSAKAKIAQLVEAYKIEAIAIGNGTAGRETETLIRKIPFKKDLIALMVNESGASVYSASSVARAEFPDYDVTVRGAVSIGRRLMDPLAELVKIDPKSIGVGQYQHDVNQTKLKESLEDVVVSCVNNVGVNVNVASKELLSYVSGVGETLAQNVIEYRKKNGAFTSRKALKEVTRFGPKAFEQAAGFLRIPDAENPLDRSAVHPESYAVVEQMAKSLKCSVADLMANKELRDKINLQMFVTEKVGLPTLTDIMKELDKPGRDPRTKFEVFEFDKSINKIEDLVCGSVVPGIVTNITAFGAFVDIGVHQDGLVHVSQMADRFVSDPNEVVKLNQKVQVRVLEVDIPRKRISLSMRGV